MATGLKNSHCSYCGEKYDAAAPWPRICRSCGNISFLNPLPVAVVLVPVGLGLIVIRRGIEPRRGMLALPGGYVNLGETWQEAGAREVFEETGVPIGPSEIRDFGVRSAPDGTLIIFGLAKPVRPEDLPPFEPNAECLERKVLTELEPLAFDLHSEVIEAYFRCRRSTNRRRE